MQRPALNGSIVESRSETEPGGASGILSFEARDRRNPGMITVTSGIASTN